MRNQIRFAVLSIVGGALAPFAVNAQTGFTAGDLVVEEVANPSSSTASAVNLLQFTTTGATTTFSIALPTAASAGVAALTDSGSASSDGQLNLSPNGQYLTLAGYDVSAGTASVTGTSAPRTVAIVTANGNVDTSTAPSNIDLGNNIRAAVTTNGSQLYTAGAGGSTSGGIYTVTKGGTTATLVNNTATTSARDVNIFNNQLYFNSSTAFYNVSSLPSGAATASALANVTTSGTFGGFFLASLNPADNGAADTLYVADSSSGIVKYALLSGTWTKEGTIGSSANQFGALTGEVVGNTVQLFAIAGSTGRTSTSLDEITDSSAYNAFGSSYTVNVLATAASGEAFDGVAFTPVPLPSALWLLVSGLGSIGLFMRKRLAS